MIALLIIGLIVGFIVGRYCAAQGYEQGRADARRENFANREYLKAQESADAKWDELLESARRNKAELERLRAQSIDPLAPTGDPFIDSAHRDL